MSILNTSNEGSSHEIISSLGRQGAKSYMESRNKENSSAAMVFQLMILAILAFVGVEAVKVIFRRNFGAEGLGKVRLYICFTCFLLISLSAFFLSYSTDSEVEMLLGSPDSLIATFIFYAILALYILIKGTNEIKKARLNNVPPDHAGDSFLLGFLIKDGWSQKRIQNTAEPLLTLSIGIFICIFNRLGGMPVIFCALSVWAYSFIEAFARRNSLKQTVEVMNTQVKPHDEFYEVNTD